MELTATGTRWSSTALVRSVCSLKKSLLRLVGPVVEGQVELISCGRVRWCDLDQQGVAVGVGVGQRGPVELNCAGTVSLFFEEIGPALVGPVAEGQAGLGLRGRVRWDDLGQ